MTEKSKRLYNAITEIDDGLVEEAGNAAGAARTRRVRLAILAAAVVLVLAAAAATAAMRAGRSAGQGGPAQAADVLPTDAPTGSSPDRENETDKTGTERDYSPVPISSLSIPPADFKSSVQEGVAADIGPFREEEISNSRAIIEGKVTKVYRREYAYRYRTAGEEWDTIDKTWTVVYEVEIGKVWYGDGFSVGETVVIEDEWNGPAEQTVAPVEGRTYVFPVGERSDMEFVHLRWWRPRIEGEVTGETEYTSPYGALDSFYFRITKTDDGEYLVYTGYPTLTAEPCRRVTVDDGSLDGELSYLKDEIRLLDGEEFAARMNELIGKYLK